MQSYLQEKIGDPDLFSGRKKEIEYYLAWAEGAKKRISHSTAILSRRKTGKTALMQRLFNLIFEKNDGAIPFYFEVKEGKVWALSFCLDFYLTFIWQYIAFKSRKPEYLNLSEERGDFSLLAETAVKEGLDYLLGSIRGVERLLEEGRSNFYFRGVQDNIFDKVFRGRYADDIREFDPQEISNEYKALYEQAQKKLHETSGKYSQLKGLFAEFAIINQLRLHAVQKREVLRSVTHNLPEDFRFVEYRHVWSYKFARPDKRDVWIDILARADAPNYSLIGEVKHREASRFSAAEAEEFFQKAQALQEREPLENAVLFVFSRQGFTQDALDYFQERGIAWSEDECWLG